MKLIRYLLILFIPLALITCGGSRDDSLRVTKQTEKTPLAEIKAVGEKANVLKIKNVTFSPEADTDNDLEAFPELSDQETQLDLTYKWFINDEAVEGEDTSVLPKDYFREGDWVYCRVRIEREGRTYPEFKSRMIRIRGPVPRVNLTMVKDFNSPGIFRYTIQAELPGKDEERVEGPGETPDETGSSGQLTYELLSPLEKGIDLNPNTGEIIWDITPEIIEELGDRITIRFSIISPSGRKVNSSISLTLEEEGTQNQSPRPGLSLGKEIE